MYIACAHAAMVPTSICTAATFRQCSSCGSGWQRGCVLGGTGVAGAEAEAEQRARAALATVALLHDDLFV